MGRDREAIRLAAYSRVKSSDIAQEKPLMGCGECGGSGVKVLCPDDMCRGAGECVHGDGEACCSNCDGYGDEEYDDGYYTEERCGCKYCPCVLATEYGEPCRDCVNGAHQG